MNDRGAYDAVARAALEVARERARQLDEIRDALLEGDDPRALAAMRVYVGIDEGESDGKEGDRANPGLH